MVSELNQGRGPFVMAVDGWIISAQHGLPGKGTRHPDTLFTSA